MSTGSPFAVLLVEQRKRRGWSRTQLAEHSGLSYPYISQLETAQRKPSRKAASQLAEALGIELFELEGAIPADDTNPRELQRAETFTQRVLSGSQGVDAPVTGRPSEQGGALAGRSRDDMLRQMIGILEEFDADERLDVLAEVQKRAMQRMLDDRGRRL